MKTVYDVLGVAPDADDWAIRKAFRNSAKAYHPDISGGDHAAEEQFKRIAAAHDLIKSPERRAAYDQRLCLKRQQIRRRRKITIAECTILALITAGAVGVIVPDFVKSVPRGSNVSESTESPPHQLEAIVGMTTEHARAAGTASSQIPSDTAGTGLRTNDAGATPPSAEFDGTRAIERKTARQSQTLGRKSRQHRYSSRTGSRGTVLTAGFAALWNLRSALDSALYRQWRSLRNL